MIILWRLIKTTWQNIVRQGLTNLVAFSIITLIFWFLNILIFANLFQKVAVEEVSQKLDLPLEFTAEVEDFQVESLKSLLQQNFPAIRELTFISAEEAFTNFLISFNQKNQELASWIAEYSPESPLPATLIVAVDVRAQAEILEFLRASRFANALNLDITEGPLAKLAATKILAFEKTLNKIFLIALVIFSLLAEIIILAVLRLTLLSRGPEITLARLVGATRNFIRLPFFLEGLILGCTAIAAGVLIFNFMLQQLDPSIFGGQIFGGFSDFFVKARLNFETNFSLIFGWQVLTGALIGGLASIFATRRFLRREIILQEKF